MTRNRLRPQLETDTQRQQKKVKFVAECGVTFRPQASRAGLLWRPLRLRTARASSFGAFDDPAAFQVSFVALRTCLRAAQNANGTTVKGGGEPFRRNHLWPRKQTCFRDRYSEALLAGKANGLRMWPQFALCFLGSGGVESSAFGWVQDLVTPSARSASSPQLRSLAHFLAHSVESQRLTG